MPRNASLAAALALAVTATACTHASPRDRLATAGVGAGIIVAGAMASSAMEPEHSGSADSYNICPEGSCMPALLGLAVGTIVMFTALMSGTDHDPERPPEPAPPVRMDGPPGGDGTTGAAPLPRSERPLPELATDARTVQLAKQVRSAALRGDCEGASLTLAAINERDPRYYAALMSSAVIAGCR